MKLTSHEVVLSLSLISLALANIVAIDQTHKLRIENAQLRAGRNAAVAQARQLQPLAQWPEFDTRVIQDLLARASTAAAQRDRAKVELESWKSLAAPWWYWSTGQSVFETPDMAAQN